MLRNIGPIVRHQTPARYVLKMENRDLWALPELGFWEEELKE
jgi:hypothetical protein